MFQRKNIFLLVVLLLASAAVGYFFFKKSDQPDQPVITFLPAVTGLPPLTLADESTGELWRKSIKSADGKYVAEEHVGYHDGRLGVFRFDAPGKLASFSCYAAEDQTRLIYEARYDAASNSIVQAKTFRADGTLEQELRRLPDGSEQRYFYGADGVTTKQSVTTNVDGSQRTITAGAAGAAATVTEVKAAAAEVSLGQRTRADGTITPALKLKLMGVRVTDWERYDQNGVLRHKGKFLPDGSVEIAVLGDKGRPVYKQTWKVTGEDWNRKFYRLTNIAAYHEDGKPAAEVELYADGATPKVIRNFNNWSGELQSIDSFDGQGFLVRREYYYSSQIPTHTQEFPPEQRQQISLQPVILMPPPVDQAHAYRMQGQPFAEPVPATALPLAPLFINP